MRRGFSLAEILTTIVIMAVLAAIAFPGFSKAKAKNEANQAVTYLRAIRLAEKMHFAKSGEYACQAAGSCNTAALISTALGTEIAGSSYAFSVTAPTTTTFTATAVNGGITISLDQGGTWTENSPYLELDGTKF